MNQNKSSTTKGVSAKAFFDYSP